MQPTLPERDEEEDSLRDEYIDPPIKSLLHNRYSQLNGYSDRRRHLSTNPMKFSSSNIEELQAFDEICWKLQNYTGYNEEEERNALSNNVDHESYNNELKSHLKVVTTDEKPPAPKKENAPPPETTQNQFEDLDQLIIKLLDLSHQCDVTVSSLHIGKYCKYFT